MIPPLGNAWSAKTREISVATRQHVPLSTHPATAPGPDRAAGREEPSGAGTRPMGMKRDLLRVRNGARYLLIAVICAAAATACGSKPAPSGGAHPNPAAACAVLLKAKNPFAPLPKGIMCPMIRVGTKTAIVKGTYFGKQVDTKFTPGGCDLAKWNQVGQIFN